MKDSSASSNPPSPVESSVSSEIFPIISMNENSAFSASIVAKLVKLGVVVSLLVVLFTALVLIAEARERRVWKYAPSTLALYNMDQVCAVRIGDPSFNPQTLDESATDVKVVNCGQCGNCSNVHDIAIYHKTSNTLTADMTYCATQGVIHGADWELAFQCLKSKVNLTDDCTDCWIGNAVCNMKNCLITCVKHRYLPWMPSLPGSSNMTDASGRLGACFDCDERLCGPAFLECSGANRRRAGVVSDISRDIDNELCRKVDFDWVLREAEKDEVLEEQRVSM